jgi:L-aspartate semialdehyde sulfurtransferase ferredoxin
VAGGRFHLTFPGDLVDEPVIHTLGDRFGLVTTIRRANLEEGSGWMILEIDGSEQSLRDALAWLAERGVEANRIDEG